MLSTKLCNLPLFEVEQNLKKYKKRLQRELRGRGVHFDFHLWVSDEWFCPDGVPGVALPFYLFNPELMNLEQKNIGYVEGKSEKHRLKLLRHELGHCIDNAFRLRRSKERQKLFGSSKTPYPESYSPQKYSRNYVHYLGDNYAQSHPDEDFAETFAVWLDPESQWRERYRGKGAIAKLLLMDRMMSELQGQRPFLKNRFRVDPIEKQTQSLEEYFKEKKKRLRIHKFPHLDRNFKRFFSVDKKQNSQPLSSYLRRERRHIEWEVSQNTGAYRYQIQFVMDRAIERAKEMKVYGTKEQLSRKTPLLIEQNFRYLREKQQLKFYL